MSTDEKRPLGKILLQRRLVTQQELDGALRDQRAGGKPLASRLIERGAVDELDALRALSEQHGVPGIDLGQVAILLEHLDVVPREVSEAHRILPVLMRGDRIFLAMADPRDKRVVDELEFVTGKRVYPYVALQQALDTAIVGAYDAKDTGEVYYLGPRVPAETLRQLGIPAPTERAMPATSKPMRSEPPPDPALVMDNSIERTGDEVEVSTADFGNVDAEVSSVAALPDEMRLRATQAAGAITHGAGKLVLVVDDEEQIRALLKRLLLAKGYRVVEADRGLLALRLVKEHMPDLIILDAMLPELHGFDIARRIRGSEKYGAIPIIMISAVYKGWRIAEDLKASYGIEEYIEKPFRIADVVSAVSRLMAAREAKTKSIPPEDVRDPEAINKDAERALREGIAAYKAGHVDLAIEQLQRGVNIDPLAYRLHFHLALLYGKKGMVYEGIQELERAVDLNPKHFPALKNLAVLYEKAGFKHKAVEMWERSAQAAPDDATREQVRSHLHKLL